MSAMPVTPKTIDADLSGAAERRRASTLSDHRGNPLATLLFWIMAPLGGICLAATAVLPAWLEYQALVEVKARAEERVGALEQRLAAQDRQIEHLQSDPAYIERIARTEFRIETPGVKSIMTEPSTPDQGDMPLAEGNAPPPLGTLAEVGATIEQMIQRYPLLSVFVVNPVRYYMMGFSAAALLTSLIFLSVRRPQASMPLNVASPH